jgi:hypothetical protein
MFTRYEIEVTRQVAGCGQQLKALVKAEVKKSVGAPDPKYQFVVDPNSLSSPLKTSEVKIDYHPGGGVAALNAAAEDRSGQVISNAIASTVKIVSTAVAVTQADALREEPEVCSKAVLDARETVKMQGPVVEAATKVVDGLSSELKALLTKAIATGGNSDEKSKEAISKAYDALAAATEVLKDKSSVLERALRVITHVETVRWPDDGDTASGSFPLPEEVFKRWTTKPLDQTEHVKFAINLSLTRVGLIGRELGKEDIVNPALGLPFRQPIVGKLKICSGGPCSDSNLSIAEHVGDILQLGYVYYLPCTSRAFSSINCSFVTTEPGQLKSMGAVQKTASAEGATGSLKDVTGQLASLQESLANAKAKKLEVQTKALKAEADYAAATAALQPDPAKSYKDETFALKASTDLLNARRANLEAETALNEALAKAGKAP